MNHERAGTLPPLAPSILKAVSPPGARRSRRIMLSIGAETPARRANSAWVMPERRRYAARSVGAVMPKSLNLSEASTQGLSFGEPTRGYGGVAMGDREATEAARRRFVGWLHFYMRTHPDRVPNNAAMARALGITESAWSQLGRVGSARLPRLKTVLAARALTTYYVDQMLFQEPPE